MAFNLRKLFEAAQGVNAQINPLDNGKTFGDYYGVPARPAMPLPPRPQDIPEFAVGNGSGPVRPGIPVYDPPNGAPQQAAKLYMPKPYSLREQLEEIRHR